MGPAAPFWPDPEVPDLSRSSQAAFCWRSGAAASGCLLMMVVSSGDISIGIKCAPGVVGPAEADIDFDIIRNDNDTFTVKYTPPGAGSYTIMVLFADQVSLGPPGVSAEPDL